MRNPFKAKHTFSSQQSESAEGESFGHKNTESLKSSVAQLGERLDSVSRFSDQNAQSAMKIIREGLVGGLRNINEYNSPLELVEVYGAGDRAEWVGLVDKAVGGRIREVPNTLIHKEDSYGRTFGQTLHETHYPGIYRYSVSRSEPPEPAKPRGTRIGNAEYLVLCDDLGKIAPSEKDKGARLLERFAEQNPVIRGMKKGF